MTSVPGTKHPAKFAEDILGVVAGMILEHDIKGWVVDPFAGVGGIHDLNNPELGAETFGVEIEQEWAEQMMERGAGWCGDFFEWEAPFTVSAVVTSPTYGNRMSDHHHAKDDSKRMTYKHVLGRELSENNSGALPFGIKYRAFHIMAWNKCRELLMAGGWMILNVKDHIRQGEVVPVVEWHRNRLQRSGFLLVNDVEVPVKGMGFGANRDARVDHEHVMCFYRPRATMGKIIMPNRDRLTWEG